MNLRPKKKIVLLGMMSVHPVAGVIWQTVHYLVGFQRLGHDIYYVEAHGIMPTRLMRHANEDCSPLAAAFIDRTLRRFDLGQRWAFQAHHADGCCYGLSEAQLTELYRSADLIINLHGATLPRPEHSMTGRLIFLETDPVALQIELDDNRQDTIDFLAPHAAYFTFGEAYGTPGCLLPVSDRFSFKPTRQPVVLDFWQPYADRTEEDFTTIGNWRQAGREVTFQGEVYHWSKHYEFLKVLDLPARTRQAFDLALSRCPEDDRQLLEQAGWRVREAGPLSADPDVYRAYIARSRAEFTVAKDQNVRLRSGWFSDRSATYLAAGRPVITQETGFSEILPTGEGLFAFSTTEDAIAAVERINADYERQRRAATALARDFFGHEVVLTRLLADTGL